MSESFTAKLPQPVRLWVERAAALVKALPRPLKIFAIATLAALALGGAWYSYKSSNVAYTTLFTNLDRDDAASVVSKLKEMKVPYRLEGDGAVIEVPEDKARELRLELAGAGLPRGGAVGFESFDKMRLGATEFEQRIQYRRALEGELSRTIGSVSAVQSARVHLVLPERSVFVSKNEPSSASVVLKLRGGRALGSGEVAGIVHLVSSSVGGLTPDHVSIVTTEGTVLHKPLLRAGAGEDAGDDERASQTRSLEATLEERARAIVEKVTGAGHVDVRVTADVDTSRVERVEDHYDPKQSALRSEERTVEKTGGDEIPVAGVPGAESNLPSGSAKPGASADGGAPAPSASTSASASANALGTSRESHTRNFEVDHVSEKRITTGGVLRRLTVAVVIDGGVGGGKDERSKEEIDKIASLVRSAVGVDAQRGDAVTVESVPFLSAEPPPPPAPPSLLSQVPKKYWPYAGGVSALLLLLTLLNVRSMLKKRAAVKQAALVLAAANAKEKAAAQVTVEILGAEAATPPIESTDDLRRLVRERAALDPATAALVVRSWLGSAERQETKEDAA